MSFLLNSKPRVLKAGMKKCKLVIFTDASLENNDCTARIGMVAYRVVDADITHKFFFSESVPDELRETWQTRTPKIISTLELFAAVLGGFLLGHYFQAVRTFRYVDNERKCKSVFNFHV